MSEPIRRVRYVVNLPPRDDEHLRKPPRKETETERLDREERERAEARKDPRQTSLLP